MIGAVAVGLVTVTSALLFAFGVNLAYLTLHALRRRRPAEGPPPEVPRGAEPMVCVQVPIFNERYVAERVVDAVCAIEWPRDRFEVQLLDDSDDETSEIAARLAARHRRDGIAITHIRRGTRIGFKAGALAYGLARTNAPFLAIFDADFVPPRDFLRRIMVAFDDSTVGFAQARWGHLDEGYSVFTRLQAMAIDFHFLIEQPFRSSSGYFTNFTGTAGVWRREAIEESGGWSARTLTEDLDLSYRAQLRGWKAAYLEDLVVPEELPVSIDAYRRQQSRWATGSFQTAFSMLGPVLRSKRRVATKFQAVIHLLAYGVGPLMLVQLLCYPTLLLTVGRGGIPWQFAEASIFVVLISVSPTFGFIVAQTRRGRPWWMGMPSLLCQVVGAGMALNTFLALARAWRPGGVFERTPKHHIVRRGQEWKDQAYVRSGDWRVVAEAALGLGALAIVPLALAYNQALLAVYAGTFALGFLLVSSLSGLEYVEVASIRRSGRRWLSATPVAALLGLSALLVLVAMQVGEPFEDGYGHWLIAANLAATGRLHDPLFSMEDTWLPAYQVLAAAVLHVFGLWQLGFLKAMSAVFGVICAACVYGLAPSRRQGVVAIALLVLNPVFLFTSGSAVVEPLLTALLLAGGLAAVRGRMKLAATFAALACVTSTKAWIWVGAVVAILVLDVVRARTGARALAWTVPALGVLVLLQLAFSPAGHSVTRGSIEVMSASARGSLPSDAISRVTELATTYGLAALPLAVFAALGALRRHDSATWRFVYAPSAIYLAAVFGLVAMGAYSGSHRYLYPALPAAALLAAAALDRYAAPVKAATVATSALLAVAFVPVFTAFAADNVGLVAAGRATSCTPGGLLTDSPVAAYYSGKAPGRIAGSQVLPTDRAEAIRWLRAHGYDSLVVEDISYYRATSVFPGLVHGSASPPFATLGSQDRFQVAGGKSVYAYEVGAACLDQEVYPGIVAGMLPMPAEGKTAPLAKGLALRIRGTEATGEGMGFGVPIVHYADGWVYSRTSSDADLSSPTVTQWKRTFSLDEIGGDAAHGYRFEPIASRGEVEVTYTIQAGGVTIDVNPLWIASGYDQVAILNEQSAAFDDFAADQQPTLVGPAFGRWVTVTGRWARLRSSSLDCEWSVGEIPGAELRAGRELDLPDFDWAGLDYIFPAGFEGTSYRISLQEAR